MRIFGHSEYGLLFVTITLSVILRGLIDILVYDTAPYSRDIFYEIWQGEFVFNKYWQFIITFFSVFGYIWGKICGAHFKVILNRGEAKKGTICRRLLGC